MGSVSLQPHSLVSGISSTHTLRVSTALDAPHPLSHAEFHCARPLKIVYLNDLLKHLLYNMMLAFRLNYMIFILSESLDLFSELFVLVCT